MIEKTRRNLNEQVSKRVWLFSDLQTGDPVKARKCMSTAVEDFKSLNVGCDQIWYLGDAVQGSDKQDLSATVDMQLELLKPLGIPLNFVLGNHDLDYIRQLSMDQFEPVSHFYDAAKQVPHWSTIESLEFPYYFKDIGSYTVLFLSDHADLEGHWLTTGGIVRGDAEKYPYDQSFFDELREKISACDKDVLIASHYSFEGGNRPSKLWNQLLPLPENVRAVFYGHSHIGDHQWGKENVYRKVAWVNHQDIPQLNISSLENHRGDKIRSGLLEIYEDDTVGIYFREHEQKAWSEMLLLPKK